MKEKKQNKIDRAERLVKEGKYNEAISLCEAIRKEYPEEESVILMLAWAYYDSGQKEQAVSCFHVLLERELTRKVFTGFAFDELVRVYKQEKDSRNLTKICERAVAAQPDDVCLLAELGDAYLQSGEAVKACDIFEKLTGYESDNPSYYCRWGEALFAAGLCQKSEKAFLKAGEIDPEQSDLYYFKIAVLFQQTQNHRDAERLLLKCIAVNPSSPLYYCSLGDSFVYQGKIKEAREVYDKAARHDTLRAGAYYNRLGHSLMRTENFPEAADAFQSAIHCEPVRNYYTGLASAYRKMGLDDRADQIMNEANEKSDL